MVNKTEVAKLIKIFCVMIKIQFNKNMKHIRSDNGSKFTSLGNYFATQDVLFETSCIGTPQQKWASRMKTYSYSSTAI